MRYFRHSLARTLALMEVIPIKGSDGVIIALEFPLVGQAEEFLEVAKNCRLWTDALYASVDVIVRGGLVYLIAGTEEPHELRLWSQMSGL